MQDLLQHSPAKAYRQKLVVKKNCEQVGATLVLEAKHWMLTAFQSQNACAVGSAMCSLRAAHADPHPVVKNLALLEDL